MEPDYRVLLIKYMTYVADWEGTTFLDGAAPMPTPITTGEAFPTQEEWRALQEIAHAAGLLHTPSLNA